MRKNDEIELTIEDMGVSGEGIGKTEGMTFFVKDALIGDHIRAGITKLKKNYGYARQAFEKARKCREIASNLKKELNNK